MSEQNKPSTTDESPKFPYSTHILFLPFEWRPDDAGLQQPAQQKLKSLLDAVTASGQWKQVKHSRQHSTDDFSRINYLHDAALDAVFEGKTLLPSVYNLEHRQTRKMTLKVYSTSGEQGNNAEKELITFNLLFKSAELNLYETGVGILSLFIENHEHRKKADVLVINDKIRRLYPPHLDGKQGILPLQKYQALMPESIELEGFTPETWKIFQPPVNTEAFPDTYVPEYLLKLLGAPFTTLQENLPSGSVTIKPLLDDRMFLMSFLADTNWQGETPFDYQTNDYWYSYLFVDHSAPTVMNPDMQRELVMRATYARWLEGGSLYGVCRYAFVAASVTGNLAKPFTGNYRRLLELCLVQRASVLKFRNEAADIAAQIAVGSSDTRALAQRIRTLYGDYIRFVNRFHFLEATPVEQGIELYDLMRAQLRVREQVDSLKSELEELHTYAGLLHEEKRANAVNSLSMLGAAFLIPSLELAYFSLSDNWASKLEDAPILTLATLIFGGVLSLALFYWRLLQRRDWKLLIGIALTAAYLYWLYALPHLSEWGFKPLF